MTRRIQILPDAMQRREATLELAKRWAAADPDAALAWAEALSDEVLRKDALLLICAEAGRRDPEAGLSAARKYELGEPADGLIGDLIAQWAERDVPAAWNWASRTADESERGDLLRQVAFVVAGSDPEAAARLVTDTGFPDGEARDQATAAVVRKWSEHDPAGAAEWVRNFPAGMLMEESTQTLVEAWAGKDAPAAERWLASLPEGEMKLFGKQALEGARIGR